MQGPETNKKLGSSCGSIGKAVASDSSGQQFESSNWQNLYWPFVYCQLYWKDENKEKESGPTFFTILRNAAIQPSIAVYSRFAA